MTTDAPQLGSRFGRYTLTALLGQGGFAWVYSAERDDGKSFALKVLKPRYGSDLAFESRFRQEAAFAADLNHPNIVHIEEVGTDPGAAYFSMELHPDNLNARLTRENRLTESEAVRIGVGVAQGLAFAHERNILHRDIKPDNILLASDLHPVITDFGIARAVSGYVAATGFMMTIGTPAYISPEQAQGRPVDGRSDLYSLGIMLYRMLAGEVPFKSRDWFELARMHVEDKPEPLRNRNPDVSKRMERIVLRLLAKHPDDRYPAATALLEDLAEASAHARATGDIPVPDGYLRDSTTVRNEEEERKKKGWWKVW